MMKKYSTRKKMIMLKGRLFINKVVKMEQQ